MKKIIFPIYLLLGYYCFSQDQIGQDINRSFDDVSGWSVSMPNSKTIAVGSTRANGSGDDSGNVRIYQWDGTSWVTKGGDINGEAGGDRSGWCVSMPDDKTVAIGAPQNKDNGDEAGHVRIYKWNGSSWVKKGKDINGEGSLNYSGYSVSMPDPNTVAIGALYNNGTGPEAGHVRVYQWNGTSWKQKGGDIDGESSYDRSGISVSMPDAKTVAIGAADNDANNDAGHVRVYQWNGTSWKQKGGDIDGEAKGGGYSGASVCMPDANTVAIGDPGNNGNGTDAGHVRVYQWNRTSWVQKGKDIDGESVYDKFGAAVSMPNANILAVGSPSSNGKKREGYVSIYQWDGISWIEVTTIDGKSIDGKFGYSVSIPDENTVAIGEIGSRNSAGMARVYSLSTNSLNNSISSSDDNSPLSLDNTPVNTTVSKNPIKSSEEISQADLEYIMKKIKNEPFQDAKLKTGISLTKHHNFTTSQVISIMDLYSFVDDKLEIAKHLYHLTLKKDKYFDVVNKIPYESDRKKLTEYIENQ